MNAVSAPRKLSVRLETFRSELPEGRVPLDAVLEAFHERGFGVVLFVFSLPAAAPVPAPGLNTLIALPLLALTFQMALGQHTVWFPKKIRQLSLSREQCAGMIDACLPWVVRLERMVKPRLGFITHGVFSRFIGLSGFIMALSGAVPLPFMNTVPAIGISLMAIGVIMRDGLIVMAGCALGLLWVALITGVYLTLGTEGFEWVRQTLGF